MKPFIFTGLSPNTRAEDALRAWKLLLTWPWVQGSYSAVQKIEDWFKIYFGVEHAYAVDSGRAALQLALEAGGIQKGDEVILQAFTCVVVSNAVTALSAKPVYVDCDEQYVMDPKLVAKAITPKTKAIIIQHTFGAPAPVVELVNLAKQHNLLVVEDCAHALGATVGGALLGTFGDLAIFSFGSDKVISGVRGGLVLANKQRADLGQKLQQLQAQLPRFPIFKEWQHLHHPLFFYFGKKTYHWGLGKALLYGAKKLRLMNRIIDQTEKQGRVPDYFPARLPATLAVLAYHQLAHLDVWNKIRQKNAQYYADQLMSKKSIQSLGNNQMWLRFPIQVMEPKQIRARAAQKGIFLGDWYSTAIAPSDANAQVAGYVVGSCPVAERLGRGIVNLPTDPSLSSADLDQVVSLFE